VPTGAEPEDDFFNKSLAAYAMAQKADLLYTDEDLVASGTWQKYEGRVAALARSHPRNNAFGAFLSRETSDAWESTNSRQASRSALVRIAGRVIREQAPVYWKELLAGTESKQDLSDLTRALKETVDREAMTRMRSASAPLSEEERDQLASAVDFLLAVPPDPLHQALRNKARKAPSEEKRKAPPAVAKLRALQRHERAQQKSTPNYCWRDQFWRAVVTDHFVSPDDSALIAVLMLVGCRPAEFTARLGVRVEIVELPGGPGLKIEIAGAKTAPELAPEAVAKGQERRTLWLTCKTAEAFWLYEHIQQSGSYRLEINRPTTPRSPSGEWLSLAEQERRQTVSLDKVIARIGKTAFPHQKGNLTPYTFRHAVAADMKAGGQFSNDTIAAALGQQSERTLQHYGRTNRGRRATSPRCQQVIRVEASSPVRGRGANRYLQAAPDPDASQ
jgi:integrase